MVDHFFTESCTTSYVKESWDKPGFLSHRKKSLIKPKNFRADKISLGKEALLYFIYKVTQAKAFHSLK